MAPPSRDIGRIGYFGNAENLAGAAGRVNHCRLVSQISRLRLCAALAFGAGSRRRIWPVTLSGRKPHDRIMADIFIILGIGIGVLVSCFIGLAATIPGYFRVYRALVIKVPPETIFPLINDFRQWRGWSPFQKLDPDMKHRFGSRVRGKGAVYTWDGNARAGAGRMAITEVVPLFKIGIRLDFVRPFAARHTTIFSLVPPAMRQRSFGICRDLRPSWARSYSSSSTWTKDWQGF